jgi:hypothetical protein
MSFRKKGVEKRLTLLLTRQQGKFINNTFVRSIKNLDSNALPLIANRLLCIDQMCHDNEPFVHTKTQLTAKGLLGPPNQSVRRVRLICSFIHPGKNKQG